MPTTESGEPHPNILFFFTDDQRYGRPLRRLREALLGWRDKLDDTRSPFWEHEFMIG